MNKRELRPEASPGAPQPRVDEIATQIGAQIRDLRKIKGLTIQQLAERVGVSIGYISQIERNRSQLSIAMLKKISDVLGVHMNWFFQAGPQGPAEERNFVVRAGNRRRMSFTGTGIHEELLSPNLSGPLELLLSTLEPAADSDFYSHDGAEAGYVLSGRLRLWINDMEFDLDAGDSFSFRSTDVHRCRNPGSVSTQVVWVITPPHY
jgi:transcriptional regulator with XRE-family HTH domain